MKPVRILLTLCVVMMATLAFRPAQADTAFPAVVKLPAQIAGGRPVTITITNKPPASDVPGLKEWTDQVGRFEKLYPNVTVTGSEYTFAPDTFAALIAGNQVPTLFQVYLTDPKKYIDMGVAADITPIFDANNLRKTYNSDIINLGIENNKAYGMPYSAYGVGLAYNIPMLKAAGFDKPPATWDELRTMAKKLTNTSAGIAGFSFINDGSNAAGWHFTIMSYTFGAKPGDLVKLGADGKYTAGFGSYRCRCPHTDQEPALDR